MALAPFRLYPFFVSFSLSPCSSTVHGCVKKHSRFILSSGDCVLYLITHERSAFVSCPQQDSPAIQHLLLNIPHICPPTLSWARSEDVLTTEVNRSWHGLGPFQRRLWPFQNTRPFQRLQQFRYVPPRFYVILVVSSKVRVVATSKGEKWRCHGIASTLPHYSL